MKILNPTETSDRIAVLRYAEGDRIAILDATDASLSDVTRFVADNISRYVTCTLIGVYDISIDSPSTPATKKKHV